MGCFSCKCSICHEGVNMGEQCVMILMGEYDGYGSTGCPYPPAGMFHESCFRKTFRTEILLMPPEDDPNQGLGPVKEQHKGD